MRLLDVFAVVAFATPAAPADDFLNPSERDLDRAEQAALDRLVRSLDDSEAWRRNLTVRRLAALGPAAVPELRRLLESTSNPKRVSMALLALSAIDPSHPLLERTLLTESGEDVVRAALLGMRRDEARPLIDEPAELLRELVSGESQPSVTRLAVLVAAGRDLVDFERIALAELRRSRNAEEKGAYLLGLAERKSVESVGAVERALAREVNTLVRCCALYGAACLAEPGLQQTLSRFQPKNREEARGLALALGADRGDAAVESLVRLLKREPVVEAVYALARIDSLASRERLLECMQGRFDERTSHIMAVTACLAAMHTSADQSVLAELRRRADSGVRAVRVAALLALAWMRDPEGARRVAEAEHEFDDTPELWEAALLLRQRVQGAEALGEWSATGGRQVPSSVRFLFRLGRDVAAGRRDPRLFDDQLRHRLRARRAHFELQRSVFRDDLVLRVLELDDLEDQLERSDREARSGGGDADDSDSGDSSGDTGGGVPDGGTDTPGTGNDGGGGSSGGDGSGGGGSGGGDGGGDSGGGDSGGGDSGGGDSGGGDSGGDSGDGGGGDGSGDGSGDGGSGDGGGGSGGGGSDGGGGTDDGGSGAGGATGAPEEPGIPPGVTERGGNHAASNPFAGLRDGNKRKFDRSRFEADLVYWLRYFPLFEDRDPFEDA